MILDTDRLRLRPFEVSDAAAVAAYLTHPAYIRFSPRPPQRYDDALRFVTELVAQGQPDARNDWHFAVTLAAVLGRPVIGGVRIGIRDHGRRRASVGYGIHHDHQGRGYATEALGRVIMFGFDDLGMARIMAAADVENTASRRVLERNDLRFDGEKVGYQRFNGESGHLALYALERGG